MKPRNVFFICVTLLCFCGVGCDDCDDCLDLQQKNILVQDAEGNNLLFGEGARFDPATVTIRLESGPPQSVFVEEETQTVLFFLEDNQTNYILELDDATSANLTFELGERESERCCGNQVYSTSTRLDGSEIPNENRITLLVP
ncbi:MAG: hypothetical protein ACFB0A_13885 [Croceivirga sp.]